MSIYSYSDNDDDSNNNNDDKLKNKKINSLAYSTQGSHTVN